MDEIRLIEAWIVTTLGGVIGLGFLYVRRVVGGPTARFWAWAWFSFFLSLFATISPDVASTIIAHAFGTGFPTLLLAGALSFAARSIPRWLIGFGFGVGVLRGIVGRRRERGQGNDGRARMTMADRGGGRWYAKPCGTCGRTPQSTTVQAKVRPGVRVLTET